MIITLITLIPFSITHGPKSIVYGIIVIALLVIVNFGYGGGFSTLPALLSERFGMKKISKIHGLSLSAWAVAGITGNNMSELILKATTPAVASRHFSAEFVTNSLMLISPLAIFLASFAIS